MRIGGDGSQAAGPSLPGWSGADRSSDPSKPQRPDGLDEAGQGREAGSGDSLKLSPEAQQQVAKLKARDQHVRAHEAAHVAAGGSLVRGAASYTYQQGPDGQRYAVGGEVGLDTSPVPGDPRASMSKAERIRAAALAPSDPSGQDRAVAAQAAAMESQASQELAKQGQASSRGGNGRAIGSRLDLLA